MEMRPSPKPMMHIAPPPYIHKMYNISALFSEIYNLPSIFGFCLIYVSCFPYFDHVVLHVPDAPGDGQWAAVCLCRLCIRLSKITTTCISCSQQLTIMVDNIIARGY